MFIVELENNVWIADIEGDPGRTLKVENAQEFETERKAQNALKRARKFRPFLNAKIVTAQSTLPSEPKGAG